MNKLEEIVARTRRDLAQRKEAAPREAATTTMPPCRPFASALRPLSLIAEHKRRSPSAGAIREDLELDEVVSAYERGGAAALSVLTEGHSFGGSLEDLQAARAQVELPILRKDFIVDPYQLTESLQWGADAILLIVAALSAPELRDLHARALDLGLAALVEIHDERELEAAVGVGAELIGINNRDLTTLQVDTDRAFELREQLPSGVKAIAESGYSSRAQLESLARAGFDAVLIGEALMRAPDIEAACLELTGN